MLVTRTFTRPATHLRKLHYSVPSRVNEWTPEKVKSMERLASDIEDSTNTNRDSLNKKDTDSVSPLSNTTRSANTSPTIQQPYQIFQSWEPDSFYSPLDFLRSRRIIDVKRYPAPTLVGPGAQEALHNDAFRQLDIDPVYETNNTTLLGSFITGMGKIRSRSLTGLSWRSQRKVTRAIKRAKQKGVLAVTSRYPVFPR